MKSSSFPSPFTAAHLNASTSLVSLESHHPHPGISSSLLYTNNPLINSVCIIKVNCWSSESRRLFSADHLAATLTAKLQLVTHLAAPKPNRYGSTLASLPCRLALLRAQVKVLELADQCRINEYVSHWVAGLVIVCGQSLPFLKHGRKSYNFCMFIRRREGRERSWL